MQFDPALRDGGGGDRAVDGHVHRQRWQKVPARGHTASFSSRSLVTKPFTGSQSRSRNIPFVTPGRGHGHQVASLVNLARGHGRQVDFREHQGCSFLTLFGNLLGGGLGRSEAGQQLL